MYELQYGTRVYSGVWTAPYGSGNVVYIGWDWRSFGWATPKDGGDWTQALQAALGLTGGGGH